MPRKADPVLEDINIGHLTKAPINPAVIKKIHDRGTKTVGKQWLSTNFSVEDKGGSIKTFDDKSAGAFLFNYEEPKGPWDAVDGIFNYAMALRMVRPEDGSGLLLLRTLHECRMFNHPKFSPRAQRELIMAFFDQVRGSDYHVVLHVMLQVLEKNAMRGRTKRPPMNEGEMLDLAKALLHRRGK